MSKSIFLPFCLSKLELKNLLENEQSSLEQIGVYQIFNQYYQKIGSESIDQNIQTRYDKTKTSNNPIKTVTESKPSTVITTTDKTTQQDKTDDTNTTISGQVTKKPCGLKNLGNTCFMNSILQCLFAIPQLTEYFLNTPGKEKKLTKENTPFSYEYQQLLQNMMKCQSGVQTVLDPRSFVNLVYSDIKDFTKGEQGDSQEFMQSLLNKIEQELIRNSEKSTQIHNNKKPSNIRKMSDQSYQVFLQSNNSIITDILYGQLMTEMSCQICQISQYTFDSFQTLSIQIETVVASRKVDVYDCLNDYISDEPIPNYLCQCGQNKSIKKETIYRFPKVLVIHLRRFKVNTEKVNTEKVNTEKVYEKNTKTIAVPSSLDMKKYAPNSTHDSKNNAVYSLFGISHHSGNIAGGHHWSEVQIQNQWYECNDESVETINSATTDNQTPYLLFYMMNSYIKETKTTV